MIDLGLLHYFLGLEVVQYLDGIAILQQKYALDMLQRFNMLDCKLAPTPLQLGVVLSTTCTTPSMDSTLYRQLLGSLLYMTHTCRDIFFTVGIVSRFSHDPHESHWQASTHILRYIWGTTCYGIHYTSGNPHIVGYTDSDWVGDIDVWRSTSIFIFYLVSGPITWS